MARLRFQNDAGETVAFDWDEPQPPTDADVEEAFKLWREQQSAAPKQGAVSGLAEGLPPLLRDAMNMQAPNMFSPTGTASAAQMGDVASGAIKEVGTQAVDLAGQMAKYGQPTGIPTILSGFPGAQEKLAAALASIRPEIAPGAEQAGAYGAMVAPLIAPGVGVGRAAAAGARKVLPFAKAAAKATGASPGTRDVLMGMGGAVAGQAVEGVAGMAAGAIGAPMLVPLGRAIMSILRRRGIVAAKNAPEVEATIAKELPAALEKIAPKAATAATEASSALPAAQAAARAAPAAVAQAPQTAQLLPVGQRTMPSTHWYGGEVTPTRGPQPKDPAAFKAIGSELADLLGQGPVAPKVPTGGSPAEQFQRLLAANVEAPTGGAAKLQAALDQIPVPKGARTALGAKRKAARDALIQGQKAVRDAEALGADEATIESLVTAALQRAWRSLPAAR